MVKELWFHIFLKSISRKQNWSRNFYFNKIQDSDPNNMWLLRCAQFKKAVSISDLKNSSTIVFSACHSLEKHVFFLLDQKKFFFSDPGFSIFPDFSPKNGFFGLFSGQVSATLTFDTDSESAQLVLSIDI